MAMIPAEKSRPARRWPSPGPGLGEPFWAAVMVAVFIGALVLLAVGYMDVARTDASGEDTSAADLVVPIAMCVVGAIIVIGLLMAYGQHPRTRSAAASATSAAIRTIMFLGGIVLFLGGALRMIETTGFAEQAALAMLSLFFLATPLFLHFMNR